jgi:hypothetical protein
MPPPDAYSLWPRCRYRFYDESVGLIPRARLELFLATLSYAAEWPQETLLILEDLTRGPTTDAEKTPTIWIVLVPFKRYEPVLFYLNRHTTLGW